MLPAQEHLRVWGGAAFSAPLHVLQGEAAVPGGGARPGPPRLEPSTALAVDTEQEACSAGPSYGLTPKLCLHFHFWSATGCHETQADIL